MSVCHKTSVGAVIEPSAGDSTLWVAEHGNSRLPTRKQKKKRTTLDRELLKIDAKSTISPLQAFHYKHWDVQKIIDYNQFLWKSSLKLVLIESVSEPAILSEWSQHPSGLSGTGYITSPCSASALWFDSDWIVKSLSGKLWSHPLGSAGMVRSFQTFFSLLVCRKLCLLFIFFELAYCCSLFLSTLVVSCTSDMLLKHHIVFHPVNLMTNSIYRLISALEQWYFLSVPSKLIGSAE